ncbi:MAG: hypothetical protein ACD_22C00205G0004 [uncultured bacterium]|nr:MAG: hypothetical protein ACD_22C00205G0004 [uncultured bacterium]
MDLYEKILEKQSKTPHQDAVTDPSGQRVISFSTNKIPKLKIKTRYGERELIVTLSSKETDDNSLEHTLLKETTKQ